MKNINIVSSKKRLSVIILVILILLALSQWWSIRMVYARKLNKDTALFFAKVYFLTAGQVITANNKLDISLSKYIADESFAFDYLDKQAKANNEDLKMTDQDIKSLAWDKVLRQAWVDNLAKTNKINITKQDFNDFYTSIGGQDTLNQGLKNAGIDVGQYENFVVKPSILEAKVYKYLLDNFNDLDGMQKAQNAYKALVDDKKKFEDVAREFSDDTNYIDDSMFATIDQLGEFGEPISKLQVGDYTKIMVLPGNPSYYVIWLLKGTSIDENTKVETRELRYIAVKAKSMDQFYTDWKNNSQINQWYK